MCKKKTIYLVSWTRIDWSTLWTTGYNYVLDSGHYCAETEEKVFENMPISLDEGRWTITEIDYYYND